MDEREWLELRRRTIGSSDAAAVCGLDHFGRTPLHVYHEKVDGYSEPEKPEMTWGKRHEPAIAAAYTDETGLELSKPDAPWYNADFPFMHATLDRVADDGRIVELKTSSQPWHWGRHADEVPDNYLVQVHHQMLVAKVQRADLAVLINGSDFRIYPIEFNERLARLIIDQEMEFFERLQARQPPDPDYSVPTTTDLLDAMFSPDGSHRIELGAEASVLAERYQQLKEQIKLAEGEVDTLRGRLIGIMGHAGVGVLPDGTCLVRKTVTRHYQAREAYEISFNEFRVKRQKRVGVAS